MLHSLDIHHLSPLYLKLKEELGAIVHESWQ